MHVPVVEEGGGGGRMCVDKHQTGEARSNAGLRSSFPILSAAKLSGRRRVDQQWYSSRA